MNIKKIKQTIYEHGGSRIYIDLPTGRELIADTYSSAEYAKAVLQFTKEWLTKNGRKEHES